MKLNQLFEEKLSAESRTQLLKLQQELVDAGFSDIRRDDLSLICKSPVDEIWIVRPYIANDNDEHASYLFDLKRSRFVTFSIISSVSNGYYKVNPWSDFTANKIKKSSRFDSLNAALEYMSQLKL